MHKFVGDIKQISAEDDSIMETNKTEAQHNAAKTHQYTVPVPYIITLCAKLCSVL